MSTVIKSGQEFKLVRQLTTIDLADHLAEAHEVVSAARHRARAITTQAQRDAAVALQEAKKEGYATGHEKGYRDGVEAGKAQGLEESAERFSREQATLCAAFDAVLTEFSERQGGLLIEARHDVLQFAVALARRVAQRVGEVDRTAATANLEQALRLVVRKTDLTVRVNPIDAETMRRFAGDLVTRVGWCEHVTVVENPSIAPGGCTVVAGATEVDAGIDTQMDEIVRLLVGECGEAPNDPVPAPDGTSR